MGPGKYSLEHDGVTALTYPQRPSRLRVQGEFDQKSQIGTKYGTKNELLDLIKYAGRHGVVWSVPSTIAPGTSYPD